MTMDLRRLLARFLPQDRRAPAFGPRIALCGLFDLPSYGDLLAPRVLERELRRRLPLARVHTYAPLGHPIAMDGGRPALPLPPKEELAEQHDLVVITGDVRHAGMQHVFLGDLENRREDLLLPGEVGVERAR